MLSSTHMFFLLLLILTLSSNCATRRPSPRILLLASHRVKIGESRVAYGSPSANTSTQASDRASVTFASNVNPVCFTLTPPSVACIDHVSQMRHLSHNDTLALAARVRALIADGALHFDADPFDKEALALACLAHDGGGWMPYDGDCSKCSEECEQNRKQEICDELFCPIEATFYTEATTKATFYTEATTEDTFYTKATTEATFYNNSAVLTTQENNKKSSLVTYVIPIVILFLLFFVILVLACILRWYFSKHRFCCECGK